MIKTLKGKVNGLEIVFYNDGSDQWVASVPRTFNGEYIIEVTAYDTAGNEAYSSTMLFMVDASTLQVNLIPLSFSFVHLEEQTNEGAVVSEFAYYTRDSNFKYREQQPKFNYEVVS